LSTAASGYNLLWSARFIGIPLTKQSGYAAAGYVDISCPTTGTITYYGATVTTVSCSASGINIPADWVGLYYRVTPGQAAASDPTKFALVQYQSTLWTPTSDWILVGTLNCDGTDYFKCVPAQVNIPVGYSYDVETDTKSRVNAGSVFVSGNVGIGTTSPEGAFHVKSPWSPGESFYGKAVFTTPANGYGGLLVEHMGSYGTQAGIDNSVDPFKVVVTGSTAFVVQKATGNVGIGTTGPVSKLNVYGGTTVLSSSSTNNAPYVSPCTLHLRSGANESTQLVWECVNTNTSGITSGASPIGLSYGTQNGGHIFRTGCTYNGDFSTTGTERMRIDSTGKVGIGTASPDAPLNIWGPGTVANSTTNPQPAQFIINSTPGSSRVLIGSWYTSGVGAYSTIQSSDYYSAADHGIALTLNPLGGNVGIGTTVPTSVLHLGATVNNKIITLYDTAGTAAASATDFYGFGINSGVLRYQTNSTSSAHVFYTGASERMRISGNGNVGIGTASPNQPLEIGCNNASGQHPLRLSNYNTGTNTTKYIGMEFRGADSAGTVKDCGQIRVSPGNYDWTSGASMSFHTRSLDTGSVERMKITSNGDLEIYGRIAAANTALTSGTVWDAQVPNTNGTNLTQWSYAISSRSIYIYNNAGIQLFFILGGYTSTAGVRTWTIELYTSTTGAGVPIFTVTKSVNISNAGVQLDIPRNLKLQNNTGVNQDIRWVKVKFTGTADANSRFSITCVTLPNDYL
jgi:hypothetical protein